MSIRYRYLFSLINLLRNIPERPDLTFTFVTDSIESAVVQAKAAAGDKDLNIIGATSTTKQRLEAGLADELHVDVMPVFLGAGLRALEEIDECQIKLERIKAMELPGGRTYLRFRVIN